MFREISEDAKLCDESLEQTHDFWGKPLELSQFKEFYEKVRLIFAESNNALHVFGLIVNDQLVASCRVLERALYRGQGKYGIDYAVAMVYVPEEHRKKGYAEELVNKVVEKYDSDDDQISLWSAVGGYYSRCGFALVDKDSETLYVKGLGNAPENVLENAEYLSLDDMPEIVECHRKQVLDLVDSLEGAVVVPSIGIYNSLQQRVRFLQTFAGESPEKLANIFGARIGKSWISWDFQPGVHRMLVLGAEGLAEDIAKLLLMAVRAGKPDGFQVVLYSTTLVNVGIDAVFAALKTLNAECELKRRKDDWPMVVSVSKWRAAGGYTFF